MNDQKIVELLVRAKLQGGRDLESITKSIRNLEGAIESQAEAAKRGENTIGELHASLSALKAIQDELGKQSGFIRTYEKLGATIATATAKIADTEAEITKLNTAIAGQEKATKRQENQQAALNKRLEAARTLLKQSTDDQNLYAEALKRIGIETSQIVDVQRRINESTLASATAYDRVKREIESYAINVRKTREALAEQAKAEREAKKAADERAADAKAKSDAQIASIRRQEQAEFDLYANREKLARAAQVASGRANAQGELANIADSEKFAQEFEAKRRKRAKDEEQAQADYIALLEERGRKEAQVRNAASAQSELQALQESAKWTAEYEKRQRQLNTAQADRITILEQIARKEAQVRGQQAAQGELANIADSEKFAKEYAARQQALADASKRDLGFKTIADESDKLTGKLTTLARASTDLGAKFPSVRDAIRDILDPSRTVAATLSSVESAIKKVADTVAAASGPIADYKDQFKNLEAAQRGISAQAGLVDQFKNQTAALRDARAEFVAARANVTTLSNELKKGGEGAQQFVRPLAEAEARLRRAAEAMRAQVIAARETQSALRTAGINTAQLANEEQRLVAAAQGATKATRDLTEALGRQGGEAEKAGKGLSLFRDEGRTTLSLAQRLRGEVLALAASYLGLQGAIGLAQGAIQKLNEREATKVQLGIVTDGNKAEADKEYEYIRAQADRIGVVQDDAAKNYAKFAVAAKLSGKVSRDEAKYIFEAFTEVSKVMRNTPDEMKGVFNALQQIISKGKLQAEELRGQLGDRLAGAFELAQKAVADKFPDLNKALEEGKVSSAYLLKFADEYRKSVEGQLPAALSDLTSQQNRLTNAANDFKRAIADGGFADSYARLLKTLTDFLQSEDGQKFADAVSKAFSGIADAISATVKFVVEYRTELGYLIVILGTIAGLNWTASLIANAGKAVTALRGMTVAASALQKTFLVLGAAIVGFEIGSYLYEQFDFVKKAGVSLVGSLLLAWSKISFGFQIAMADFPTFAQNAMIGVVNFITSGIGKALGLIKKLADALDMKDASASIQRAIDGLAIAEKQSTSARVAKLRKEAEEDANRIRDLTYDMLNSIDKGDYRKKPTAPKPRDKSGDPTPFPGFNDPKTPPNEKDIDARNTAIQSIENALDQLEARIDRAQTETLQKQLDAIDKSIEPLQEKIKKLGGSQGAAFQKRLDDLVAEQKLVTTRKFNQKLADEQEALTKKIEAAEVAAGKKSKLDVEARLEAVRKSYEATYREIAELREKLLANGQSTATTDEAKKRLDLAVQEQLNIERQKTLKDQLADAEGNVNSLVQERAAKIQLISDLQAAGVITQQEAEARQLSAVDEMQPKIELLTEYAITLAESMRGAFEDQTALDAFIAKMEKARTSSNGVKQELNSTGKIISGGIGAGVDRTLDAMIEKIKQVREGTADWGDVFDAVGKSILQSLADILLEIGKAIIKQQILVMLKSVGVPVAHSGTVVGSVSSRSRSVDPGIFAAAPRYHTGGIVGLAPNEYPAILEKNEEVLKASDPRNVLNGGLSPSKDNGGSKGQRFVLVDDRSKVAEAMASAQGEDVVMQHVFRNIPSLRQRLK